MTPFKICGLRDTSHANAAADAGACLLGFVFVPGVRRQLTEAEGRRVIERYRNDRGAGPRIVGLFANQPVEEVNRLAESCGLDMVQLCGDETPEYWERMNRPIIKQIKVPDSGCRERDTAQVMARVAEVVEQGHVAQLDSHQPGALGGTGHTFDWSIAREVGKHHDFLLAGGLDPENVREAIEKVDPWGVDVSSGVETGGVKDVDKIAAFAAQVRAAG